MFKLFNRFAWGLSLVLWFVVYFYFAVLVWWRYSFQNETIFLWLFFTFLNSTIIKKLFFSKKFIWKLLNLKPEIIEKEEAIDDQRNNTIEKLENEESSEDEINETLKEVFTTRELEGSKESPLEEEEKTKIEIFDKWGQVIKGFFAENLLAKVGSILVFLGVLFLLSLVWSTLGAVHKVLLGFVIGFSIFGVGVWLDKKGLQNESRILLGLGILVNYLVILSGRYLIGDNYLDANTMVSPILQEGLTFFLLIMNTGLAIATSLVYKSRLFLLFSFVFAYLNPLLVGGSADQPYTLVGYALIVSLGWLFLAKQQNNKWLLNAIFIGGNLLFLVAPFMDATGWIIKLASTALLSLLTVFLTSKLDIRKIPLAFVGSYVFLILLLINASLGEVLVGGASFVAYMLFMLVIFTSSIFYFLVTAVSALLYSLLFPVCIVLLLIFSGGLTFIPIALGIIVLTYLVGFLFLEKKLAATFKYVFFAILAAFIFMTNGFMTEVGVLELSEFITVAIVSFIFIWAAYCFSRKEGLEFLYSMGTIGGICTLLPIVIAKGDSYHPVENIESIILGSVISVIIFALLNWLLPFINNNLVSKLSNLKNLVIGSIAGVLFIAGEMFVFGQEYFPGVTTGIAFLVLAVIYFVLAYGLLNNLGLDKVKEELAAKNVILAYLGISISLFSLAIAIIFTNHPEIISVVWLFEATILFYFFKITEQAKVFIAGMVLFVIGVVKLFALESIATTGDFVFLIPLALVLISLVLNLKFLDNAKEKAYRLSHDIMHLVAAAVVTLLAIDIIPSTGLGWKFFGTSLALLLLSFIYAYFKSSFLKKAFLVASGGFFLLHLGEVEFIFSKLDYKELEYLRGLQYLTTALLAGNVVVWQKINKQFVVNNILKVMTAVYVLAITSIYVLDIFTVTFSVTIYWGILASVLLFYGMQKEQIKLRTVGLYVLSLTLGKIFLFDLWYGIDDAVSRVIALMVIGSLMIALSTLYSKKYGGNLLKEFSWRNLR